MMSLLSLFFSLVFSATTNTVLALKASSDVRLIYNIQDSESFLLKTRVIKNKKEYFLSFQRGQQTYKSRLIDKKQYDSISNKLNLILNSKARKQETTCNPKASELSFKNSGPFSQNYCLNQLPLKKQKSLRFLLRQIHTLLYGETNYDLI